MHPDDRLLAVIVRLLYKNRVRRFVTPFLRTRY